MITGKGKSLFFHSYANELTDHLEEELRNIKLTSNTEVFQEGRNAFLENRKANFNGK